MKQRIAAALKASTTSPGTLANDIGVFIVALVSLLRAFGIL